MNGEPNIGERVTALINSADVLPEERTDLLETFERYGREAYESVGSDAALVIPEGADRDPTLLQEIVSPKQFLGFEHIDDFRKLHRTAFTVRMLSVMFSGLVWPRKPTLGHGNMGLRINPADIGLVVREREAVGFPALPRAVTRDKDADVVQKVVRAGSVIMFSRLLIIPEFRRDINGMKKIGNVQPRAVTALANDLVAQIEQSRA